MNPRTLRPINKNVTVELDRPETESAGGIIIPSGSQEMPQVGTVLAIDEKLNDPHPCDIQPGDRVHVPWSAGTHLRNPPGAEDKCDVVLLKVGQILFREDANEETEEKKAG